MVPEGSPPITKPPNTAPFVAGVFNHRGKVIILVDLALWLEESAGRTGSRLRSLRSSTGSHPLEPEDQTELISESHETFCPLRVLHADDFGMIRKATRQSLEEGKEFIVASTVDGSAAWEYLMDLKKQATDQNKGITDFIDIVLTDVEMPQMDGYHLCHKIKSDPLLKELPVVLFSLLITDKLFHKGESVHAYAQLSKPNPKDLIHKLKEIMLKR